MGERPGAAGRLAAEVAVGSAHTTEWAYVLAVAARAAGDLDVAEDCVQDAYAQALVHWAARGVPARPGAWLTTVATRRALEQRRRAATLTRKLPLLVPDPVDAAEGDRRHVPRRPAAAGVHLLPSGVGGGDEGRPDAAAGVRSVHP